MRYKEKGSDLSLMELWVLKGLKGQTELDINCANAINAIIRHNT